VVAANGTVSCQCAIVIVDPSTPPLWDKEDYRIIPVECLYGIIEVRSFLHAGKLRRAWDQIAQVKALPKAAYLPDRPTRTGTGRRRDWQYVPTVGMVAYDGASLDGLSHAFEELADQYAPEHSLDSVWVLTKAFINWTNPNDGNLEPGREPGAGYTTTHVTPQQILMSLTTHLHQHFGTAWMPDFNIENYLTNRPGGTVVRERVPDRGATGS